MIAAMKSAVPLLFLLWISSSVLVRAEAGHGTPQFVFVHGMGHGGWCFTPLITLLEEKGYTATAVDLTAHGINKAKADDVVTVAEYIEPLTTLFETAIHEPTIIVGHSLGGGPIAVIAEMFPAKVSKAVFLAAIYPNNGQTFFSCMPASTLQRLLGEGDIIVNGNPPTSATLNKTGLTSFFYNKSPKWSVTLAKSLLVPTPYRPANMPIALTAKNFGTTRKFYINTLLDYGITSSEQLEMIGASSWKPEKIYPLPNSDHAAFFSQKTALSVALIDIAMA